MESLYHFAQLVNNSEVPKSQADLTAKINRPVEDTLISMPLSIPEKKVKDYLDRTPHDVTVADAIRYFTKVPYGWSDYATIFYIRGLL